MDRKYYSQHGEDCILWQLFKDQKEPGFFVDVGALDGMCFSNTYSFEQAGWKGICIEAHPDYIKFLKKNRPNSIVIHAAISNQNKKSTTFYANKRGALSTLVGELRKPFQKKYKKTNPSWTPIQVPMKTLTSVLEVHNSTAVDLISMDVEGGELAILREFNFDRFKPRIWVIEAINKQREIDTDKIMKAAGYKFARKLTNNFFFCRDKADVSVIANAPINGKLIHTIHPCDVKNEK
jgi:FkbM family methyltransferase